MYALTTTFFYIGTDGVDVVFGHLQYVVQSTQNYLNDLRVFGRKQVAHWRDYSQAYNIRHLHTHIHAGLMDILPGASGLSGARPERS